MSPIRPLTHAQRMKAQQKPAPDDRPSAAKRGYDHTWRKIRRMKLDANPLCQMCEKEGLTEPAIDVDHITPLARGGTNDWRNLQSLCKTHHSRKTAMEDGGFTGRTKQEEQQ